MKESTKLIAFYLPQFHPIPENDLWWGKEFTEWTNVKKAKPNFDGHYQPRYPGELGYYDLRDIDVQKKQIALAKEFGIYGFCYYYYWFSGKRLLERPLNQFLENKELDFPFCICWANENWTRIWDGQKNHIILEQTYSIKDDQNHINSLIPIISDPRYIRINNKPLVLIYRVSNLPNPRRTADTWREHFAKYEHGELFLCKVESSIFDKGDPQEIGFDGAVEFQPDWDLFKYRLRRGKIWGLLTKFRISNIVFKTNSIMKYSSFINKALIGEKPNYQRFPCVTPRWDNSPRKKEGCQILIGSTPKLYEYWLKKVLSNNDETEFVFINAWNEWGEGNHLEPDQLYGRGYLEATLNAKLASTLERKF